jgi:hypothetical protein
METNMYRGEWSYYRDKKGYKVALEKQFPELVENNAEIRIALDMMLSAERIIDSVMKEREEKEV